MKNLAFIVLTLVFAAGCRDVPPFENARKLLSENKDVAAAVEFEKTILAGQHAQEAHAWLADFYAGTGNDPLHAALHARKALENADEAQRKHLHAIIDSVLKTNDGDLRGKINLLEEHARKQAKWLDELRRENAQLRRELADLSN